jgi:hypothetical protein
MGDESMRPIEEFCCQNTVNRLAKIAGEHAEEVHRELVAFSPEQPGGADGRKVVVRPQKRSSLRPEA